MKTLLPYYIALQPWIKEAMGERKPNDLLFCDRKEIVISVLECFGCPVEICKPPIRIPATIDNSSPEASKRSLWGMLEGESKTLYTESINVSEVRINKNSFVADTPTEAILKALKAQQEERK